MGFIATFRYDGIVDANDALAYDGKVRKITVPLGSGAGSVRQNRGDRPREQLSGLLKFSFTSSSLALKWDGLV